MTTGTVTPDPLTEPQAAPRARLQIIDKLRGLVIILMVLDHVRDFFSRDALLYSPTDLDHTTIALFATRWVTHLCAPTFVALAGVAVFLQRARGKRGLALTRFLVTRGLWLIALELTWVSFGFSFDEPFVLLQVIWAIGACFILLALVTPLPPLVVLALGLAIVGGHDAFAHVVVHGPFALPWTLMMAPGRIAHGYVPYPALPWFGIMACGYGAGGLFQLEPGRRDRILVALGLAMLAGFALLRGFDGYGDPATWARGADSAHSVLAFLKVTKYPPSLDYTLATLGIVLTLAPAIGKIGGRIGGMLLTFGRVPLFVYLIHLYLAHGAAVLVGMAMGVPVNLFFGGSSARLLAAGGGVSLGGVYLAWAAVVLALWPLATWYGRFKMRRRDWWLGYL